MTPKEIQAAVVAFRQGLGPQADVLTNVSDMPNEAPLCMNVYPSGICGKDDLHFRVEADEWAGLLDAARAKWVECKERHGKQVARKIALAIIAITRDFGDCSEPALRGQGFTQHDINTFGAAAVAEANTMADCGPFSIAPAPGANMPAGGLDADRVLQ